MSTDTSDCKAIRQNVRTRIAAWQRDPDNPATLAAISKAIRPPPPRVPVHAPLRAALEVLPMPLPDPLPDGVLASLRPAGAPSITSWANVAAPAPVLRRDHDCNADPVCSVGEPAILSAPGMSGKSYLTLALAVAAVDFSYQGPRHLRRGMWAASATRADTNRLIRGSAGAALASNPARDGSAPLTRA